MTAERWRVQRSRVEPTRWIAFRVLGVGSSKRVCDTWREAYDYAHEVTRQPERGLRVAEGLAAHPCGGQAAPSPQRAGNGADR